MPDARSTCRPGVSVTVWAPALGRQFADIETMFEAPFFPVPYDRLPPARSFSIRTLPRRKCPITRVGASDWGQCARFAAECDARFLYLFHHKPGRPDTEMAQLETAARAVFPHTGAAKEGVAFTL